jgi:hypothetical protein
MSLHSYPVVESLPLSLHLCPFARFVTDRRHGFRSHGIRVPRTRVGGSHWGRTPDGPRQRSYDALTREAHRRDERRPIPDGGLMDQAFETRR